jgi:hypothetical protein
MFEPGAGRRAAEYTVHTLLILWLVAFVGAMIVSSMDKAYGAPPENADPALAPWFQSLRQPETGMSCCDIADCRPTEYRMTGDDYEVWIDNKWMTVPPRRILQRTDNPVGRAVVCWTPQRGIMCFVRAVEAMLEYRPIGRDTA